MRTVLRLFSATALLSFLLLFCDPALSQGSGQTSAGDAPTVQKQEARTYTLSPEKYEKAVTYSKLQDRLHFVGIGYSLLVLFVLLSLRVAPKYRDLVERLTRRRIVQAFVFVPIFFLTIDLLQLPLEAYRHRVAVQYEISVQSWQSWLWDWTKGELIEFILASILVYILYAVIRRSPRRWWFYFWLASVPLLILLLFITPVVFDPLFNKFEPLQNNRPELVTEIEKVLQHGGLEIPRDRMYEMKASEKVNAVDAYVTGFGGSKRVVVWDTTIEKMTTPQTVYVIGHEAGHYVLGHIPKSIAFISILLLALMFLVFLSVRRTFAKKERQWLIRGIGDWASLPALMLFALLFLALSEPIFNTFSRYQEHQADIYGLEVIHGIIPDSNHVAAEAFQVLGEIDLADPEPSTFIKIWLYNHPPLGERLVFARDYDPWSRGEMPMFVR